MTIGNNIKKLRTSQALTQEQLAGRLYVTRQTVSSWEVGKSRPDLELLEAIAAALGTDVMSILYGPEPKRQISKKQIVRTLVFIGVSAALCIITALLTPSLSDYYRGVGMLRALLCRMLLMPLCGLSIAVSLCSLAGLRWDISLRPRERRGCLIAGGVLVALYCLLTALTFLQGSFGWLSREVNAVMNHALFWVYNKQLNVLLGAVCGVLGYLALNGKRGETAQAFSIEKEK